MGVIADLMVNIGADIGSFKHGMNQVGKDVEDAGGGFAKFGKLAMGAGMLAAGAVTGVAAFGLAAVEHARASGQEAYLMSQKFGLLPEVASRWIAIADDVGITSEQMSKGFQFLSKNVSAMQITLDSGGKISAKTGQVYQELGINIMGAGGRMKDAETLMMESADAFQKMEDGPEKAAYAMKLFGKSGTDLLPMLNQGSAGIKELMKDSVAQGEVMSGPQVEAAHKLTLAQRDLNQTISGATTQIGIFLIPMVISLVTSFQAHLLPTLKQLAGYFMEHVFPALQQVYAGFMQLIGPALDYIRTHFDDLKPVLMAFAIMAGISIGAVILIIGILVAAVVGVVVAVTWLSGQVAERIESIKWSWNTLVTFVTGLSSRIGSAAGGMWDGISNAFRSMLNRIVGWWNHLHFDIPSILGSPAQHIAVPSLPYFHQGGMVPGSGNVLAMLQGGEEVISRGGGRAIVQHFHFENALITDGPLIDILTNKIAQRMRYGQGT